MVYEDNNQMASVAPVQKAFFHPAHQEKTPSGDQSPFPAANAQFCKICNFVVKYRMVICCLILSSYLLIGAMVFRHLESDHDKMEKKQVLMMLDEIAKSDNISGDRAIQVIEEIAKAINTGFDLNTALEDFKKDRNFNHDEYLSRWTVAGGYFFSTTVITTIGYGHMAPATAAGRGFCVLYAMIGVPLCFLVTGYIGGCYTASYRYAMHTLGLKRYWVKFLLAIFFLAFGFVVLVFLPVVVFMYGENWNIENSWYACITTLTTVGFGDFVPGIYKSSSDMYRFCLSVWIYMGLAYVTMVPDLLGHCFIKLVGYHKCKLPPPDNLYDSNKF